MTQEDKDLLLKDLCARLPYKVKVLYLKDFDRKWYNLEVIDLDEDDAYITSNDTDKYTNEYAKIEDIKPYLFPLSNMTKEQYLKWGDLEHAPLDEILFRDPNIKPSLTTLEHHLLIAKSLYDPINYCYENHFDIYGLIEKGLAIDATGKNIY